MSPNTPNPTVLFGEPDAVACERAAAELRSGRPVVIQDADGVETAILAVESATPQGYAAFAAASEDRHALSVTATRASVLGLEAPAGARIPLAGQAFDALAGLSYLPATAPPTAWSSATPRDAGAAALARLALLLPALVAYDLPRSDAAFAHCLRIRLQDLAATTRGGTPWEEVARTRVPLRQLGDAQFVVFRGGVALRDQVAIVIGQPDLSRPVPVRVHSSCLTGDLFGSLKCDCGDQLRGGLDKLGELGGGILLYLDQEGRGTGIAAKMRAYGYQHQGLDTIDADALLGFGPDERRYESAAGMLRALGVAQVHLLTNNPSKVERLRGAGIDVVARTPVTGRITADNEGYLRTKAARAGHALDVDALIASLS